MPEQVSTGLSGLDAILNQLRKGDNVVWQVDSIEDFAAQPNQLTALLPDKAKYADVIKVIDLADAPAHIVGDVISQQVICFLP